LEKKPNLIHYIDRDTMDPVKEANIALVFTIALNEKWHDEFQKADLRTANIPWDFAVNNFYSGGYENLLVQKIIKSYDDILKFFFPNEHKHSLHDTLETQLDLPPNIDTLILSFEDFSSTHYQEFGYISNEDRKKKINISFDGKIATYGTILRHALQFVNSPFNEKYLDEYLKEIKQLKDFRDDDDDILFLNVYDAASSLINGWINDLTDLTIEVSILNNSLIIKLTLHFTDHL